MHLIQSSGDPGLGHPEVVLCQTRLCVCIGVYVGVCVGMCVYGYVCVGVCVCLCVGVL